ncbi:hypothetical protein [Wenzhouxiangella sp. EGI_FJ10409]|uniref:hypothetical protein n=1 Tax=Wenzhouxiangella sp. EGI_FJ10409 TaxID=3243767 RepID=UPI0035E1EC26
MHDGHLIAGGRFATAGGVIVNRLARWDDGERSALAGPSGTGVDSNILDLAISANGSFAFATAPEDGRPYEISVLNQPSDPVQTCAVTNGSGTLSG